MAAGTPTIVTKISLETERYNHQAELNGLCLPPAKTRMIAMAKMVLFVCILVTFSACFSREPLKEEPKKPPQDAQTSNEGATGPAGPPGPPGPIGWSEFIPGRGRTIIGTNPDSSNGLSPRTLVQQLGEERHTLTTAEMPNHSHVYNYTHGPGGGDFFSGTTLYAVGGFPAATSYEGGGASHNIMQPSLALLYCQKS